MNGYRIGKLLGILVALTLALLFFPFAGAQSGDALDKIEPLLLETFSTEGTSDMIIRFTEQADLSPAYSMDWAARGEFVYNTLKETAERTQGNAKKYLDARGLAYHTFIAGNELYVWGADLSAAQDLAGLPEVYYIRAPRVYHIDPLIEVERPASQAPTALAWGLIDVGADQFWGTFGWQGDGILVANIDTGVQYNHPALDQAYKCWPDPTDPACWEDPSNICGGSMCDNSGHGTHTMGTMVADDDPTLTWQAGMAPNAQWIACKGCESSSCSSFALNTCADWILAPDGDPANRPHVVNNSWGGGGCNTWYQAKVQAWRAAGTFPAFSAGNSGSGCSTLGSPGDYQESFGSAAHDSSRNIAGFSSRGPSCFGHEPYTKPNISAPGVSVCSTVPGNGWSCSYSGTSMASPHSAGAVALLWSCNPSLIGQIDMTFEALQNNTDAPPAGNCGAPPDGEGNYTYGYGYLNVYNAGLQYCAAGFGYLDGTVYDAATGNPIEGATVTAVRGAGGTWDDMTDPTGYYTMNVAVGTFAVTATHPLYTAAYTTGVDVLTDSVTTVDFYLQPRGRLFGYVTDYDNGFPLEGALVEADNGVFTYTNAAGYYEMYLDEGTYVVTATMQDYAPDAATVVITSGMDTQQDFALMGAVVFIPSPLHVTVDWQTTYNEAATVTNRLPYDYAFEFQEVPGGFIPLAEEPTPAYAPNPPVEPPVPLTTGIAPDGFVPEPAPVPAGVEGVWEARATTPFVSMDNVFIEYDGMGYLVGGYGANGQVGIYDPVNNSWTTGAAEPSPRIQYTVDGCFGLNAAGEPVIVIFNDTASGVTTWHRYNIATNSWDTPPVPAGFPANGLWASDIVSTWRYNGQNVCYISGGATTPGGGNLNTLYEYHPDTHTVVNLGNFTLHPAGFDFHASWYVPWVGSAGAICVGGGVDSGSVVFADTQCYDIAAGAFNAPNADLGQMLEGVWGTADGILYENGDYQLYVANGADAAFQLWPNSMYYSRNDGQWYYGPAPLYSVYRVEGDNVGDGQGCDFYVVTGSSGGFTPTSYNERNTSATNECPPTAGADCLWLGEVPTATVVPAQSSMNPTIYFTATYAVGVDQPGDYYCDLNLAGVPMVSVRVTMTVLPAQDMGKVEGTVWDNCTGAPLEDVYIAIAGGNPITETETDENGYYAAWLVEGTYTLDFSLAGYLSYTDTVTIVAGQTTTLDVNLIPDRPCLAVDPDWIEVWVLTGTAVYTFPPGLDIINGGGQDLDVAIFEQEGLPGLIEVTIPAGPSTAPAGTAVAGGVYVAAPETTLIRVRRSAPDAPPNVLLVHADDGNGEPIRSQLQAYGDLGLVDVYDARAGTPTLPQLQAYDVVVTWSNYVYQDPTGIGNVLADYVDAGGRVINLMFSMGTHGWAMQGRFMTQEYTAINGTNIIYGTSCLGTYDPNHPIMSEPDQITNVCDYYRLSGTYMTPGSHEVARWQDGQYFVAAKDDRTVVSITGYVGTYRQWTGQMDDVVHNAILWLTTPPYQDVHWVWEVPTTTVVPPTSIFNVDIAFTALYTDMVTPMPLGTYTATLLVTNNAPEGTQNVPVVMHIIEEAISPTAAFSTNSPVCLGEVAIFTNTTIPGVPPETGYLWDFGDGVTSTLENPTHLYGAAGTYTVTLEACNMAGCDTYVDLFEVLPLPTAGFTFTVDQLTVTFTNLSGGTDTYLWAFGDGAVSTATNPTHVYTAAGTYTVTLFAAGPCGEDMAMDWVTVGIAPTAGFLHNAPVCLGEVVVLTNTTTGTPPLSYLWDLGDGITSTLEHPTHTYAAAGTYTVTLWAGNDYGEDTTMAVVEVLPLPLAAFTWSPLTPTVGSVVTFTNGSLYADTFFWALGDGAVSTATNPTHVYTAAGTYTVTLQASGVCGVDTASAQITVIEVAPPVYYLYLPLITKNYSP